MPLLNVALVPAPHQVVVRLIGESDLSTVEQLADALRQAAGLGSHHLVVDVSLVRFWDCSGLRALVDVTAELARTGRQCRIVGATAATRRLVALANYTPLLVIDGPVDLPVVAGPTERTPPAPARPHEPARSPVADHPVPAVRRWRERIPVAAAGARRWR